MKKRFVDSWKKKKEPNRCKEAGDDARNSKKSANKSAFFENCLKKSVFTRKNDKKLVVRLDTTKCKAEAQGMKKFLYSVFMISLSIAVVMLSPFIVSGFAAHNSNSLVCGVIDEELSQVISFSSEFEYIPVAIWIEETDLDAIEKKALAETGMNRSVISVC